MEELAKDSPVAAHAWFLDHLIPLLERLVPKKSPKKKRAKKGSQASQRRGGRGTQASQDGDVEEMTALSQREVGKVVQGLVEVLSCPA